jgi:ABC-type Zn uptake system ZnuABC Zn-binding protein ZnuA
LALLNKSQNLLSSMPKPIIQINKQGYITKRSLVFAVVGLTAVIVAGALVGLYLPNQAPSSSGLKVLATFYPLYDFAQNVGGDKISASILVPETVDVHDFEPTPSDLQNIATADILIYNGADLEKTWLSSVVTASGNTKLVLVDTSKESISFKLRRNFKVAIEPSTRTYGSTPFL